MGKSSQFLTSHNPQSNEKHNRTPLFDQKPFTQAKAEELPRLKYPPPLDQNIPMQNQALTNLTKKKGSDPRVEAHKLRMPNQLQSASRL
jgi:hypothetical protein